MGMSAGTFTLTYETYGIPDRIVVSYEGQTLFDSGCIGTNGSRTQRISYSGSSALVTVQVTPNCSAPRAHRGLSR